MGNGGQDQRYDMLAIDPDLAAALAHVKLGGPPDGQREECGSLVELGAVAAHHSAKRVFFCVPRSLQDRALARVLSATHITAPADGSPQGS